jgi:hypothetical protein
VHERAYKRLLADIPDGAAAQVEFLAHWRDLDTYVCRSIADGMFAAVGAPVVRPDRDRPARTGGVEVVELAEGLMVSRPAPPRVHHLNNTAAIVLELCDGERTVTEIAELLAEAFGLGAPLGEVSAGVEELRRAGILADRASPAEETTSSPGPIAPTEGRTP